MVTPTLPPLLEPISKDGGRGRRGLWGRILQEPARGPRAGIPGCVCVSVPVSVRARVCPRACLLVCASCFGAPQTENDLRAHVKPSLAAGGKSRLGGLGCRRGHPGPRGPPHSAPPGAVVAAQGAGGWGTSGPLLATAAPARARRCPSSLSAQRSSATGSRSSATCRSRACPPPAARTLGAAGAAAGDPPPTGASPRPAAPAAPAGQALSPRRCRWTGPRGPRRSVGGRCPAAAAPATAAEAQRTAAEAGRSGTLGTRARGTVSMWPASPPLSYRCLRPREGARA